MGNRGIGVDCCLSSGAPSRTFYHPLSCRTIQLASEVIWNASSRTQITPQIRFLCCLFFHVTAFIPGLVQWYVKPSQDESYLQLPYYSSWYKVLCLMPSSLLQLRCLEGSRISDYRHIHALIFFISILVYRSDIFFGGTCSASFFFN